MLYIISFELKRAFRSKLLWFAMMLMLLISFVIISEIQDLETLKGQSWSGGFEGSEPESDTSFFMGLSIEQVAQMEPKYYPALQLQNNSIKAINLASQRGDHFEVLRLNTLLYLMLAKQTWYGEKIKENYFDTVARPIWDSLKTGLNYDDYDRGQFSFPAIRSYNNFRSFQYYALLNEKQYLKIEKWDVNTHTYTSSYFNKYLPICICAITLVFTYNSINKEKGMGSLKLLLTQDKRRYTYYLAKWISNVASVSLVVLLPWILVTSFLWLTYGAQPMDYPALGLKSGMERLMPISNLVEKSHRDYEGDFMSGEVLAPMPAKDLSEIDVYKADIHPRISWLPFYQYMLTTMILTLLYIGFIVALVLLISALINHQVLSLVVAALFCVIGTALSWPYTQGTHLNISPFGMNNGFRIVNGSYNTTSLMAILVLTVATVMLLVCGTVYFKKKAI